MAGVIDAKAFKTDKLNRFGYVNIIPKTSCDYIMQGEEIKGHEFHYYESSDSGDDMLAVKPNGARKWQSIHAKGNLFAGFAHLFYYSNPEFIYRFLK